MTPILYPYQERAKNLSHINARSFFIYLYPRTMNHSIPFIGRIHIIKIFIQIHKFFAIKSYAECFILMKSAFQIQRGGMYHDMDEVLRLSLMRFVRAKFHSYPNIATLADDIVQEAYLNLLSSRRYSVEKENFGYLSVSCLRVAYRQFMAQSRNHEQMSDDTTDSILINEKDFIDEILEAENTQAILASMDVLKEIEKIIVTQRYYGDFSFSEIAEANNLKLNTVLSHHRRALEKLRPRLTRLLGLH